MKKNRIYDKALIMCFDNGDNSKFGFHCVPISALPEDIQQKLKTLEVEDPEFKRFRLKEFLFQFPNDRKASRCRYFIECETGKKCILYLTCATMFLLLFLFLGLTDEEILEDTTTLNKALLKEMEALEEKYSYRHERAV